jgi:hypothetical protein
VLDLIVGSADEVALLVARYLEFVVEFTRRRTTDGLDPQAAGRESPLGFFA